MKPRILIMNIEVADEQGMDWISDGWNDAKHRGTPKAQELMELANRTIVEAKDAAEAIRNLEACGFEVCTDIEFDEGY